MLYSLYNINLKALFMRLLPFLIVSFSALLTYLLIPTIFPLVILSIIFIAYSFGLRNALIAEAMGVIYFHLIYRGSGQPMEQEPIKLFSFIVITFILSYFVSKFHILRDDLLLSRQKYETVITAAPDVIITTNDAGSVIFTSPRVFSVLGYKPEELLGKSILEIIPELSDKTFNWNARNTSVIRKDGIKLLMEISIGEYTSHGKKYFTKVLRDVSEKTKLEQANKLLSMVVQSSDDAIITKTLDGLITSWNKSAERMFGYKSSEIIGKSIMTIIPDNLIEEEKEILQRIAKGEKIANYETTRKTKDGKLLDVSLSISPIINDSGQIVGAAKISRDVTRLKKIEHDLRISEQRFALAQEAADIASWEWYPKTGRISWSRNIERIYGIPDEEFNYDKFNSLLHPDDKERVTKILSDLKDGKTDKYDTEFRIITSDGKVRWLSARGKLFPNGEGMRLIGSNVDITEQKRYEDAVKASEERFRIQFKSAPVPIFTWQRQGDDFVLIDFNDATLMMTNGKPSILLGKKAGDSYKDTPEIIEYMNQAYQNKSIVKKSGIYRMRTTGEEKYVNATIAFVPDDLLLVHMEDVTEQHEAHEQLKASMKVAEEASAAKDQFLAILSHELRTPMASILGYSNLLLSKKLPESEQETALKAIDHSAKVQVSLIDDLLDVSRIVSGKIIIRDLIVGVPGLIKQLMPTMQPAIINKKLTLTNDIPDEVLFVKGDPERLQQALMNLVDNSIKFTESGAINISVVPRGMSVDILVKDTGIGISNDIMPKLFQKFLQGEVATRRKYKGLGLGLYIAKSIVDLHHGRIFATSEVGKGTTMTISLPLVSPPLEEPVTTVPNYTKDDLSNLTILVVDDDIDTLTMLKLSLERFGATVIDADSAEKAKLELNDKHVDIIVSDVGMPVIDGLMFMEQLRKVGNQTPSIALTAFDGLQYELEAKAKGFNGFLSKPIGIEKLVNEILKLYKGK
jgi:PAS domain S-box-containing protein